MVALGRLSPSPRRSLAELVSERLREAIYQGELKPGQRLIQADIARRMGVSRIPVREALSRLAEEGLIECRPHRGAVVRRPVTSDVEQAFATAAVLERAALELAVDRATDHQIDALERLNVALARRAATGRLGNVTAQLTRFHRELFLLSGLPKLYDCIEALKLFYPPVSRVTMAARGPAIIAEHGEIIAALRARDRARLLEVASRHAANNARVVLEALAAAEHPDDQAAG